MKHKTSPWRVPKGGSSSSSSFQCQALTMLLIAFPKLFMSSFSRGTSTRTSLLNWMIPTCRQTVTWGSVPWQWLKLCGATALYEATLGETEPGYAMKGDPLYVGDDITAECGIPAELLSGSIKIAHLALRSDALDSFCCASDEIHHAGEVLCDYEDVISCSSGGDVACEAAYLHQLTHCHRPGI